MKEEIKKFFKGEVFDDERTLIQYSKDASLFEVRPKLVVWPQNAEDLENLVRFINERKQTEPELSLTMRAAGSDMTGGPLNNSIIADVTKHINKIGDVSATGTTVEPGAYYHSFEEKTLKKDLILPCYPASKNLAALGGMIANNCGGERTLRYGKMENFVSESKYIFSDGKEYVVKPLSRSELEAKIVQNDFEGNIYKQVHELIEANKEAIEKAKPKVTKNSSGYFLWNVDNGTTFDLNRLLTGSQGTLGLMTEAKLRLVQDVKHHDMVALFFKSWDELPQVVSAIMPFEPEDLETFDDDTLRLGIRFMPEIAKKVGSNLLSFASQFIPEAFIGMKMLGFPELIVLVEIGEGTEEEVKRKVKGIVKAIKPFKVWHRVIQKDSEEEKFWVMRRESFNLLREHVKDKRTVPLVEDFCIDIHKIPEFLPRAKEILESQGINVNIAGHAGNGNFHIIPLMDLRDENERAKLIPVAERFYSLVHEFGGSISGEHNDGIVRTPFLNKMYSPEMLGLFKKTKQIFDPKNIFNPGKKVGGTLEDFKAHLAR